MRYRAKSRMDGLTTWGRPHQIAFGDEGRLIANLKELPEHVRACISEIKFTEGVASSVKFWSKPQALHLAATHLRLLVELSEQKTSLEIRIREMTPDQRKQFAMELLTKARRMLPIRVNAEELEHIGHSRGSCMGGDIEADNSGDDEAAV
jgi:hypothetical protein